MTILGPMIDYPGALASSAAVLDLADAYGAAARLLLGPEAGRPARRLPLERLPGGLCAVQAIELYLGAFLLHRGERPEVIRGMRHDLAARAERALLQGLVLKLKTTAHLVDMTREREYLVLRYAPEQAAGLSRVNRLTATLDEVAAKVRRAVRSAGAVAA